MISVGRNTSKPYMASFGLPRGIVPTVASSSHEWIELVNREKVSLNTDRDWDVATPLQRAIFDEDMTQIRSLLNKATVNYPSTDGNTPLHAAVKMQSLPVVKLILDDSTESCVLQKNNIGVTPLHLACGLPNRAILNTLLKHTPYSDVLDDEKLSPLHFAVLYNQVDNVKMLIYNSANPNVATVDGFTPLHVAACMGLEDIVLSLISFPKGAQSAGSADNEGWVPLHCAVYYQHITIVRLLVQIGYAEASNNDGYTPLHLAAYCGFTDAITILLPYYTSTDIRTFEGLTPKQVALKYQNFQLALELKQQTSTCIIS